MEQTPRFCGPKACRADSALLRPKSVPAANSRMRTILIDSTAVVWAVFLLCAPRVGALKPISQRSAATFFATTPALNASYTYPPAEFTEAHRGCFNHGSSFQCTTGAGCTGQFYPDLTTCLDNWQAWWVATQAGSSPAMPSPVWVLRPGSDTFPCLNLDIASVVSGIRAALFRVGMMCLDACVPARR